MLCGRRQIVLLPEEKASCPMANMASAEETQTAFDAAEAAWGRDGFVPITYQNSLAEVKALCGRYNGAVCTSGNAQRVFEWALGQDKRILFFPDQWLGTNTALAMGIPQEEIGLWDPLQPEGGSPDMERSRVVVWRGFCHVHTRFTVEHVQAVREKYDPITVIVHPETPSEVVAVSDLSGSTSFILKTVGEAEPGSRFAIGTELHMVQRLARDYPDRLVEPLCPSTCGAMARITAEKLAEVLDGILEGNLIGRVTVPAETAHWANKALERMLAL
jgi:quinolinate synthase